LNQSNLTSTSNRLLLQGQCKFGDKCTLRHDCEPEGGIEAARKSIICKYFLNKGKCRHKERCVFSHRLDAEETKAESKLCSPAAKSIQDFPTPSLPAEGKDNVELFDNCGICLNNVVEMGRRFALYSNCQHCFCYECARSWHRKQATMKKRQGIDVDRTLLKHSCPICRVESDYIVPSKYQCTGVEKEKVFEDYKKIRSIQPCTWFEIGVRGSCPFGSSCFYKHADHDGSNMKPFDVRKPKGASAVEQFSFIRSSEIEIDAFRFDPFS
jgi:E3 ubiquitin-protein ligase makorin